MKRTFMSLLLMLTLGVGLSHAQCAMQNTAFKSGEFLAYNLYYNWKFVWVKAGTASLSTVRSTYRGRPAYRSSLITRGNDRTDDMFVLRDTLTSYCTLKMEPLYYRKGAREGKRYNVDQVFYSYSGGRVHAHMSRKHTDGHVDRSNKTYTACVYDMLNIFMRARSFKTNTWKKGHVVNFSIVDGNGLTPAKIIYYGKYYIKGDNGKKYKTLRLSYMEKEKGKYKEIARFYVTDDTNHIPIRLDMYLRFGSAKAYLTQMKGNRKPVKTY
ncbi:MAG: DUF3108 domain-containing protein [Prevotella sp.]